MKRARERHVGSQKMWGRRYGTEQPCMDSEPQFRVSSENLKSLVSLTKSKMPSCNYCLAGTIPVRRPRRTRLWMIARCVNSLLIQPIISGNHLREAWKGKTADLSELDSINTKAFYRERTSEAVGRGEFVARETIHSFAHAQFTACLPSPSRLPLPTHLSHGL